MAMNRREALTRCGRVYAVLGRVLHEEAAGSADDELNLDATFEELGIDDDSKKEALSSDGERVSDTSGRRRGQDVPLQNA